MNMITNLSVIKGRVKIIWKWINPNISKIYHQLNFRAVSINIAINRKPKFDANNIFNNQVDAHYPKRWQLI